MPISPADFERYAAEVRRLYEDVELVILERIARRAAAGVDTAADDPHWTDRKLAEIRRVIQEVERELQAVEKKIAAGLLQEIELVWDAAAREADRELAELGELPDLPEQAPLPQMGTFGTIARAQVETLAAAAVRVLEGAHLRVLREAEDAYRQVIYEAARLGRAGVLTYREAMQQALYDFAARGITGFVDRRGRRWELQAYAEMAVRSSMAQAAVQGHINRLLDRGYELVIVSDSPEECPICRPWEGAILSLTGAVPKGRHLQAGDGSWLQVKGTLAEAISAGLFHPNCTHRLGAFITGLTKPLKGTENPQGYAERQEQRYIERNIRRWKRIAASAAAAGDEEGLRLANAKVREWQERMREFIQRTGRQRQRWRESPLRARSFRPRGGAAAARRRKPTPPPPWRKPIRPKRLDPDELRKERDLLEKLHDSKENREGDLNRRVALEMVERFTDEEMRAVSALADWFIKRNTAERLNVKDNSPTAGIIGVLTKWNETSGDHDPIAVAIQLAAQQEFGLKRVVVDHYSQYAREEANKLLEEHGAAIRAVLRRMYEHTQDTLKKAGIDELTVYRGFNWFDYEQVPEGIRKAVIADEWHSGVTGRGDIRHQALSSYTTDPQIADHFAYSPFGLILAARVPRERVIGMSVTGFGTRFEREVVLLAGEDDEWFYVLRREGEPLNADRIMQHVAEESAKEGA